jgi:hypothetical protein
MSIGSVSPASTPPQPPQLNDYLTSSTAPYQASPTNSTASNLPLSQTVAGSTDHTFTASTVDHELNAVNTPNPLGTSGGSFGSNAAPDTLAQSGIGINVSATQ